jgi:hypothetical protein
VTAAAKERRGGKLIFNCKLLEDTLHIHMHPHNRKEEGVKKV